MTAPAPVPLPPRRPRGPLLPDLLSDVLPGLLLLVVLVCPVVLPASPALAQQGLLPGAPPAGEPAPGEETATEEEEPPPYPARSQVGPRYLQLVDEAAEARRRLEGLTHLGDLEEEVAAIVQRGDELSQQADRLLAVRQPRMDDLLDLRQAIAQHRDDVAAMVDRLAGRIAELDELRESWVGRRDLWQGWRDELAAVGELGAFRDDFDRALDLIGDVLREAEGAVLQLARAQAPLRRAQEDSLALVDRLEDVLTVERGELLAREAPPLLSPEHRRRLAEVVGQPLFGVGALRSLSGDYFAGNAGLLVVGLLLFLAAALAVRHFRRRFPDAEHQWQILLSHPWATGAFIATAVTLPLYAAPPPAWRLALLAVLAGSACVLTRGMFRNRRKRLVVYALAALYVLLQGLETFGFPTALYRLVVSAVALAGVPTLVLLARREERTVERRTSFAWLLYAAAVLLGLALAAQVLGYRNLGRWLLENGLATAFVLFTVVFLVRLGRGAIRASLQRPEGGALAAVRRVGYELSGRLIRGLELVLGGLAFLYLLTVWGVYPSPWEAWDRLLGAGLQLGRYEITVAQVLLGLLVVYLAFVASGVVRALVDEELGRRRELEPGVAHSVATLAHYALVVVGLLVALGVLGFDLSTFAIILGALGVGIGFGLQDIVNNFFSGLILLFERPVRVGDVVIIDGNWAVIKKIGLRSTVVTTYDYSEIIVPNANLISEKVTNWTLTSRVTRVMIPVGVAYGSDLETVFRILEEVVAEDPRVTSDPAPMVHFAGFGDSALLFEVRVWITDISERLGTRSQLLREIDRRFREAGVTIPFPQRDVHLYPARPGAAGGGEADPEEAHAEEAHAGEARADAGEKLPGQGRVETGSTPEAPPEGEAPPGPGGGGPTG